MDRLATGALAYLVYPLSFGLSLWGWALAEAFGMGLAAAICGFAVVFGLSLLLGARDRRSGRPLWRCLGSRLTIPALIVVLAQFPGAIESVAQEVGAAAVMQAGGGTASRLYSSERLGLLLLALSAASFAAAWHYAGKKRVFL